MVVPFVASRLSLLLVVPILLIFAPDHPRAAVGLFLVCLTLFFVFDACGSLPWFDLFSHLLPPVGRTRLVGMGQFISGAAGIGTGLLVAAILGVSGIGFPVNYALLFSIASALFALEVLVISRVRAGRAHHRGTRVPLSRFLPKLADIVRGDSRFRRFLGVRLLVGTAGLAMPFYVICALDRLKLGAVSVGLFIAAQVAGGIAGAPLMALLAERRGPTAIIRVAAGLGVVLPLSALGMLLLGTSVSTELRVALFAVVFVVMGAMNNGIAAGFTNYLLDIAPTEGRTAYVGFANTFNGLILFMPLIGGWILGRSSWVALFLVTTAAALAGLAGTVRMVSSRSSPAAGRSA
jgi:MFS family permease